MKKKIHKEKFVLLRKFSTTVPGLCSGEIINKSELPLEAVFLKERSNGLQEYAVGSDAQIKAHKHVIEKIKRLANEGK